MTAADAVTKRRVTQRGKAITPKARDEIEALLDAGVAHADIAEQFGLTPFTVKRIGHLLNRLKKTKQHQ